MTRPFHTGTANPDYFVAGHCISAYSPDDAIAEARHLYGIEVAPSDVRRWTAEDQAALDAVERTEWNTHQLREDFTIDGFSFGMVVATRKSDGVQGSMQFERRGDERIYFGWVAA